MRISPLDLFKNGFRLLPIIAWGIAVIAGCAVVDERSQQQLDAAYGPNAPRWEATYAAERIPPGDLWRIFLKGSDPDGDLEFIHVWMEIPSRPTTPVRLTIDPDQKGRLSGYLLLNSLEFGGRIQDLVSGWIRLRVVLEDRARHQSQSADFFLQFSFGASVAPPPAGVFQERFLGKIPVEFAPVEPAAPGRRFIR